MNSLTGKVGLKLGPLVLGVLVKHWFDRLKKERSTVEDGARMREDDILYDQVFVVIKEFLNVSRFHTVEELQSFSNTRTPSQPWVHVVRTMIPLSCCDRAATYLIKALGGEEVARQVVGGVKWWQVRGINGVDAEWITMKNDWREAKKRHKAQAGMGTESPVPSPPVLIEVGGQESNGVYDKDMDAMRCILYLHGGGYYFGSVDQSRYSTQRFGRKINGRVFAINYRLAPQYPFPCGLHDALAAYLFLIRPPPGSEHEAVNPAHVIISGDSAGGGLSLALLQVIRDAGLPLPAGGVLISPWCDLTHSFPSVYLNIKNDILPECGLSFHKPSILWPPPSSDVSKRVHASLRFRIKQALRLDDSAGRISQTSTIISEKDVPHGSAPFDPPSQSAELTSSDREKIVLKLSTGEDVEITGQLQLYTLNSLIQHPLVSPITGYLGGLPPLMFIAGDEEVLRDEIIYTAHKAAYPERYPVLPSSRLLCPHIQDIENRFKKPTSVHLQVYDGAPHIFPVLFQFTVPSKFCFRAIANFDRFVTDMKVPTPMKATSQSDSSSARPSIPRRKSLFASYKSGPSRTESSQNGNWGILDDAPLVLSPLRLPSENDLSRQSPLRRVLSGGITQAGTLLRRDHRLLSQESREDPLRAQSESHARQTPNGLNDITGPEFQTSPERSESTAGEPQVYENIKDHFNWECRMIRERVSTSGIIRPLESEEELPACKVPHDLVAQFAHDAALQYVKNKQRLHQEFQHMTKSIEKSRHHNLTRAHEDTIKRVTVLQQLFSQKTTKGVGEGNKDDAKIERPKRNPTQSTLKFDQRVLSSPGWTWSWVLDEFENPPPSSIVARRDTEEARRLAAIADWATREEDHDMSGNNLWSVIQNFLGAAPPVNGNVPMNAHGKDEGT